MDCGQKERLFESKFVHTIVRKKEDEQRCEVWFVFFFVFFDLVPLVWFLWLIALMPWLFLINIGHTSPKPPEAAIAVGRRRRLWAVKQRAVTLIFSQNHSQPNTYSVNEQLEQRYHRNNNSLISFEAFTGTTGLVFLRDWPKNRSILRSSRKPEDRPKLLSPRPWRIPTLSQRSPAMLQLDLSQRVLWCFVAPRFT